MMSHDKLKYQVNEQFLSREIIFRLRQSLHCTITVKHLDNAKDASLVSLPVKYCDRLQHFCIAAFVWYIVKRLFHEYLCLITF